MFKPIKPMLASKKKKEEIYEIFANKNFLIETKFDGERLQCHITPDDLKFFTRNSNDYTMHYGPKLG